MRKKKVFIIGHYGGDNFGDEIMLDALIENLLAKKQVQKIFFVTKKPSVYSYSEKVKPIPNNIKDILRTLIVCQVMILGGGTHFHDDYTKERYGRHFFYLSKIILISFLLRIKLGKVYYLGVGYGPLKRTSAKLLSWLSCQLANQIVVRDNDSYDVVIDLIGKNRKLILGNDLVTLSTKTIEGSKNQSHCLGISITSFQYSGQIVNDSIWEDEIFQNLSAIFSDNVNLKIKLFVLRGGERESDFNLTNKLLIILKSIDPSRVELVDFTYDLKLFIEQISYCNFFIATRFHSAVLAYLCGCSISIIPYHRKLISFAKEIGISHRTFDFTNHKSFYNEVLKDANHNSRDINKMKSDSFHIYDELLSRI